MALRASDSFSAIRSEFNLLRAAFDAVSAGLALPPTVIYVTAPEDFPTSIFGVINLIENTTYIIAGDVDLAGDRIACAEGSVIAGASPTNSSLTSTGLAGNPLISSDTSLTLRDFKIHTLASGVPALSIDAVANPGSSFEMYGMEFEDVHTVGTIKDVGMILVQGTSFEESSGLTLDGTINIAAFFSCMFNTAPSGTFFNFPATAIVTSRFKILYSSFIIGVGETGIDVDVAATVPAEGFILDSVTFSGGGGYLSTILSSDDKSMFKECTGIPNSSVTGHLYWIENVTATTIATEDVPVKATGTSIAGPNNERFTHTTGRLTNSSAKTRTFIVAATLSLTSGNNHVIGVYIADGGTVIPDSKVLTTTSGTGKSENVTCQTIVTLYPGEYVELFVENTTAATNITVSDLSLICRAL